ncbi:MAG: hypothetical protein MHMPM18_000076 [Marteilia pararefringens]
MRRLELRHLRRISKRMWPGRVNAVNSPIALRRQNSNNSSEYLILIYTLLHNSVIFTPRQSYLESFVIERSLELEPRAFLNKFPPDLMNFAAPKRDMEGNFLVLSPKFGNLYSKVDMMLLFEANETLEIQIVNNSASKLITDRNVDLGIGHDRSYSGKEGFRNFFPIHIYPNPENSRRERKRVLQSDLSNSDMLSNDKSGKRILRNIPRDHRRFKSLYGLLFLLGLQFGSILRLTWWDLSWDEIEPVTFMMTLGNTVLGLVYFLSTREAFTYDAFSRLLINPESENKQLECGTKRFGKIYKILLRFKRWKYRKV